MSDTLALIKQTVIMATAGTLHSGVRSFAHIPSLQWAKLRKAVPGLFTTGNVGQVKGSVYWAEKITSSNVPAGENDQCVWVGVHEYQLLDKEIM